MSPWARRFTRRLVSGKVYLRSASIRHTTSGYLWALSELLIVENDREGATDYLVEALTARERSALTLRQRNTWLLVSLLVSLALAAMAFAVARCRLSLQAG